MLEQRGAPSLRDTRGPGWEQFQDLLGQIGGGAYTCAADGRLTWFNPTAVELWGRVPNLDDPDARYCGSARLYAPDGAPIAHGQCWMALALRDLRPYLGEEILIERPDGGRRHALAFASPVRDEAGGLLGGINVLFDVTGQKEVEQRLQAAEHRRGQFLVGVARELRAQLAPLRATAQVLSALPASVGALGAVDVIDRQVRSLTRLVDRLLDYEIESERA